MYNILCSVTISVISELSDCEVLYLLGDIFEQEGLVSIPVTRTWRVSKAEMLHSFLCHVKVI